MRFSRNRRVPGIRHPPYFIPKLAAPNSPAICGLKLDGTRPWAVQPSAESVQSTGYHQAIYYVSYRSYLNKHFCVLGEKFY